MLDGSELGVWIHPSNTQSSGQVTASRLFHRSGFELLFIECLYLEGQGDLVSRLTATITLIMT